MFIDTFQVSDTFSKLPDENRIVKNGWKPRFHTYTGEISKFILNGGKEEHAPRLTISEGYGGIWHVRAEVSPSAWIGGSNLNLLNEPDFLCSLELLSEMVSDLSGYRFDAKAARVSKVDFTRNFLVGDELVLPIIKKYYDFTLPKYKTRPFPTSVYFENAGKLPTKIYKIYSKYHERQHKNKSKEQELAKGILRLEISHRKVGVNNMAKSLRLKSNTAKHVLTQTTATQVIDKAMKLLKFSKLFSVEKPNFENLFEAYSGTKAVGLVGYLFLESRYGDISTIPSLDISAKTIKRYRNDCCKAGILSLE